MIIGSLITRSLWDFYSLLLDIICLKKKKCSFCNKLQTKHFYFEKAKVALAQTIITCSALNSTNTRLRVGTPGGERVPTPGTLILGAQTHTSALSAGRLSPAGAVLSPAQHLTSQLRGWDQVTAAYLDRWLNRYPGRKHQTGVQRLGANAEVNATPGVAGPDVLVATGQARQFHSPCQQREGTRASHFHVMTHGSCKL